MFPIPEEALDTALSFWETAVFVLLLLLLLFFFFFAITEGVLLDAGLKSDLALFFCGVAETNSSEEEEAVVVDFRRAEEEKGDFLQKIMQPHCKKEQRNRKKDSAKSVPPLRFREKSENQLGSLQNESSYR